MSTKHRSRCGALVLASDDDSAFKSQTPRWLHPLLGRPLLGWPIALARQAGCADIVVVAQARAQEALAAALGAQARVVAVAGASPIAALRCGLAALDRSVDEVLILRGDQPLLERAQVQALRALRRRRRAGAALLLRPVHGEVGVEAVQRAGDRVQAVQTLRRREERAVEEDTGLWLLGRALLERLLRARGSKSLLGQALALRPAPVVTGQLVPASQALQVEDRLNMALASRLLRAGIIHDHMAAGVGFEDPTSTLVEPDVVLGADAWIGSHVQLLGRSAIASGARVEACCVVVDSQIAGGAVVRPFCHLEGATVRAGAIVGPYARLRPQADIGEGAHIGNFVEVKKTTVEPGAKANHLAYLGDARVGRKANIGAGTITCNYDGVGKNFTDIGQGVFVGSNSTLVAPIRLEDGVYVAAGSTLTADVPADALAFGRARQENKPGLAAKLRARMQARAKKPA
jgi:bifunctional UDP-N-acetylglucosamine pyrophosphorylase/glucosamine-1-phosphate N-acetyltransferase